MNRHSNLSVISVYMRSSPKPLISQHHQLKPAFHAETPGERYVPRARFSRAPQWLRISIKKSTTSCFIRKVLVLCFDIRGVEEKNEFLEICFGKSLVASKQSINWLGLSCHQWWRGEGSRTCQLCHPGSQINLVPVKAERLGLSYLDRLSERLAILVDVSLLDLNHVLLGSRDNNSNQVVIAGALQ